MKHDIFENYCRIADCIAGMFGEDCEVAVHDLTNPLNSVVYVANGTVTGRKVGQSFDHLVRQVLLNKNFKNDHLCNYRFETEDGKPIISSSVLIRENDEVIGMLCINCDASKRNVVPSVPGILEDTKESEQEGKEIAGDVMAILDELIMSIIGNQEIKHLQRKRCVELVKFMDEKGIFLVKGAIDKVAGLMGVSKVTIYSYLDEAKGKR